MLQSVPSTTSFFIINGLHSFLIAEGNVAQIWENTANIDLDKLPLKFRWLFIDCPHQAGCFYIVNFAENSFLDTHGQGVSCWNHHGRPIQTIINENTSCYAKNIRWTFMHCNISFSSKPTGPPPTKKLRILHLSDTHNMHKDIEKTFPMPPADIFLHTGDFSNQGSEEEVKYFNEWLGEMKKRYQHVIIILGNHDRWSSIDIQKMRVLLNNALILDNEEVQVNGLRIYGTSWAIRQPDGNPDGAASAFSLFSKIPKNVDILMTHCPPFQIFDKITQDATWGSSQILRHVIEQQCPKVHLFGHLHEQRGIWSRNSMQEEFTGGVEFDSWPYPSTPPPKTYPCQLISCNAMKNHSSWDGKKKCIAGPARLITATMQSNGVWTFT